MATQAQLATRILHKLRILDPLETESSEDGALALEKLKAAHYTLKAQGLVRWTLADIPDFAEEAYVLIGAYLAADVFSQVKDPEWMVMGVRIVQSGIHVPIVDECYAQDF